MNFDRACVRQCRTQAWHRFTSRHTWRHLPRWALRCRRRWHQQRHLQTLRTQPLNSRSRCFEPHCALDGACGRRLLKLSLQINFFNYIYPYLFASMRRERLRVVLLPTPDARAGVTHQRHGNGNGNSNISGSGNSSDGRDVGHDDYLRARRQRLLAKWVIFLIIIIKCFELFLFC